MLKGSRQAGLAAVFVLVTLALGVLIFAVVVRATSDNPGPESLMFITGSFALVTAGMVFEFRRDLDAALTFSSVMLIILAALAIPVMIHGAGPSTPEWFRVFPVAAGVVGLALGIWTFARQHLPDGLYPNLLKDVFSRSSIFEVNGVQYSAVVERGSGSESHLLTIVLQNCHDAERKVEVDLSAERREDSVLFAEPNPIDLSSAEVVRVDVPVVNFSDKDIPVYIRITAKGTGGKRVRRWRAQVASSRPTRGTSAALLAVGVLWLGGGVSVKIPPHDSVPGRTLPEGGVMTVWPEVTAGSPSPAS